MCQRGAVYRAVNAEAAKSTSRNCTLQLNVAQKFHAAAFLTFFLDFISLYCCVKGCEALLFLVIPSTWDYYYRGSKSHFQCLYTMRSLQSSIIYTPNKNMRALYLIYRYDRNFYLSKRKIAPMRTIQPS